MAGSPEYRTSKAQWDGKMPLVISSPRMAFATSAVEDQGPQLAPCDLEIVEALVEVLSSTTSSAAKLNIGDHADPDSILDAYSLENVAAGLHSIDLTATEWATTEISRGDVVEFSLDAATAAGEIAVSLVCMPRGG